MEAYVSQPVTQFFKQSGASACREVSRVTYVDVSFFRICDHVNDYVPWKRAHYFIILLQIPTCLTKQTKMLSKIVFAEPLKELGGRLSNINVY